MKKNYDLVVLGSGVAGGNIAIKCRNAGLRVALIEKGPLGGTCALRGCNPKKVLVHASEAIARYQYMKEKGIKGNAKIDWSDLIKFKKTFTQPIPQKDKEYYQQIGVDLYMGKGVFQDEKTVQVNDDLIEGKKIVVATGAKPRDLSIPGAQYLCTSDCFLELDRLPEKIIFVGGGYIAFEFAHIAARAGAQVTILHRDKRPLNKFDPDVVAFLLKTSSDIGIDVQLEQEVSRIEKKENKLKVYTQKGQPDGFEADLVVHGAGRVPDIADLGLDAGRISRDERGILVDQALRSQSNSNVYVAGDANAYGIPLTPVADMEADIISDQIINHKDKKVNYHGVPSVLFTFPVVASVGLREEEAKKSNIEFEKKFVDTSEWVSNRRLGIKHSAVKILIDQTSRQIIGAHLMGYHAEEVIGMFALVMRHGLTAEQIKDTVFGYPTFSDDIHSLF